MIGQFLWHVTNLFYICHLSGLGLSQQLQNCRRLDPLFKLLAVILYCIATPTAVLTPQHTKTGMAKDEKSLEEQVKERTINYF